MNLLFIDVYCEHIYQNHSKCVLCGSHSKKSQESCAVPPCPRVTVPCTTHKMSEIHTIVLLVIQAIQNFENQYGLQAASETRETS